MSAAITSSPPVETGAEKHRLSQHMHTARMAWRAWRRSRPLWAGVWTVLGGVSILYFPLTAYRFILVAGTSVVVGVGVGVLITVFGLFFWFAPRERQIIAVLVVILAVVSLVTSDYGGFVIGMLLAMIGGSLGFAWVPVERWKPRIWDRKGRREWREWKQRPQQAKAIAPDETGTSASTPG